MNVLLHFVQVYFCFMLCSALCLSSLNSIVRMVVSTFVQHLLLLSKTIPLNSFSHFVKIHKVEYVSVRCSCGRIILNSGQM